MSIYPLSNQDQIEFEAKFKFIPLSFSWVAIHPKPKGIIQFIGGALFGSFPTIFYDYLFRKLFAEGYTIVAFTFRFTFDHWSVSLELLREQYILRQKIIKKVVDLNYDPQVYLEEKNYNWLGHSLGAKYILLLEILSGFKEVNINSLTWQEIWQQIKPNLPKSDDKEAQKIPRQLENLRDKAQNIFDEWLRIKKEIKKLVGHSVELQGLFLRNQPSLLIAPDISNTVNTIPIRQIANLIDRLGWGVKPTRRQTQLLIENSSSFSLMAMLSFDTDMIAGNLENSTGDSDVAWLFHTLKDRLKGVIELENTYHLEPHGHQVGKYVVDFPGSIIVWSTGLAVAPLIPFSQSARAFFNEVRKPLLKTIAARAILEQTILELLQKIQNSYSLI